MTRSLKQRPKPSPNQNTINTLDTYLCQLSFHVNVPLLDESFHVFLTEVSSFWPAMTIKHSKVEDAIGHLGDLEAVFILLAPTDEGGAAYLGQADFRNGLPIANAGRQQDGLVNSIVPNAERIPSGGAAAAVGIEPGIAVATF